MQLQLPEDRGRDCLDADRRWHRVAEHANDRALTPEHGLQSLRQRAVGRHQRHVVAATPGEQVVDAHRQRALQTAQIAQRDGERRTQGDWYAPVSFWRHDSEQDRRPQDR